MCVSINGPGNPDLWPFDLETGRSTRIASKAGNLPSKFVHARPFGSRIIRYVRDRRTDRRTDGQKQRLLPFPYGAGIITHFIHHQHLGSFTNSLTIFHFICKCVLLFPEKFQSRRTLSFRRPHTFACFQCNLTL